MVFDVSIAMTWILFLALFPMAFFWLRRAWRIFVKKNYSDVALKGGVSPKNPEKFALFTGLVNVLAGAVAIFTIVGVFIGYFHYDTWSALAGITIWSKIFIDFIISRQAHPFQFGRKKKLAVEPAGSKESNS